MIGPDPRQSASHAGLPPAAVSAERLPASGGAATPHVSHRSQDTLSSSTQHAQQTHTSTRDTCCLTQCFAAIGRLLTSLWTTICCCFSRQPATDEPAVAPSQSDESTPPLTPTQSGGPQAQPEEAPLPIEAHPTQLVDDSK